MASIHPRNKKEKVHQAAAELLQEGKSYMHGFRDQGLEKLNIAQKQAKEYSNEFLEVVREHPLRSIIIAGGIGLLLSALIKKS